MSELQEDLAAFAPRPTRTIRIMGHEYPLRAFLDLRVEEALDILHGETDGQTGAARERAILHQVAVLVPDLSKSVVSRLTPRQSRSVVAAASEGERDPKPSELRLGFWFAQAARFYHMPWSEIRTMSLRQLQRFLSHAPELRARERMEEAMVAAFPHMEASGREALRRKWMGVAGVESGGGEAPRVPWDQVRAFIGAGGNA